MAIELCGLETEVVEAEFQSLAEQALARIMQTPLSAKRKKAVCRQTPTQSENDIQTDIIKWLKAHRIFCYRQNNQGRLRMVGPDTWALLDSLTPGIPDIGGVLPGGTALYIEVKKGDWNHPREETLERAARKAVASGKKDPYETYKAQREFIRTAKLSGAVAFFAKSVADVERELRRHCDETWCPLSLD